MSIDLQEEAGGKVLVIEASGTLTSDQFARFARKAEELIQEHGKVRILCQMHNFHGWKAGALREDLEFDLKHMDDIERLAFVGDKASADGMAAFCRPYVAAMIRCFDESKADEARGWIYDGLSIF